MPWLEPSRGILKVLLVISAEKKDPEGLTSPLWLFGRFFLFFFFRPTEISVSGSGST